MKTRVRLFAACLAALMLTACGEGAGHSPETAPSGKTAEETPKTSGPAAETDGYGREVPDYPLERGLDFKGYDIRMLSRENPSWSIDFGVEEMTGELVNDAVYNRNLSVQSDLNVVLTQVLVEGTGTDEVMNNFRAGDTAYDIAGLYQMYGAVVSLAGAFMNLYDVPYVDFSNPWWNRSFTEELTYDDQLYFSVGDMNVSVTATMAGIFFNQAKYTDFYGDPSELYDTVRAGKWTRDEFVRLLSGTYVDLNGNKKKDEEDSYGFVLEEDKIGPWIPGFDIRFCTKDDDGVPQLSFYSERSVEAYEWMYDLFLYHGDVYYAEKNSGYLDLFRTDRALFSVVSFDTAATILRDMESPYGVLPMPKFDELQEEYRNTASDGSNLTGVIYNTKNPGAVGAALELLSYYSYLTVTPAYFEVALKHRYFEDSDSGEMFDLIRNGTIVDFGQVYSLEIGGGTYSFETTYHVLCRNQIRRQNRNIASRYKRNEKLYKKKLGEIIERYEIMGKKR